MLSVILIWLYMLFTCYVTGFACIRVISGKEGYSAWRETDYLYAGTGAVMVYSQFFSIFWRVGLWANLVLLVLCIVCILVYRTELADNFFSCCLPMVRLRALFIMIRGSITLRVSAGLKSMGRCRGWGIFTAGLPITVRHFAFLPCIVWLFWEVSPIMRARVFWGSFWHWSVWRRA